MSTQNRAMSICRLAVVILGEQAWGGTVAHPLDLWSTPYCDTAKQLLELPALIFEPAGKCY